jgi:pimeloyl-ACP methyl ester carboxylesterase
MVPAIAITALTIVALAVAVGRIARHRLRRLARPIGRLVEVDGRRVHLIDAGDGPAVVLVGGTWAPAVSWGRVIEELVPHVRVVAPDRPGLGWSDTAEMPRTPSAMADELSATLRATGITHPVVLVGHSYGGVVARVFADRYRAEVAGLVLLDAAHETQFERFPEPVRRMTREMSGMMPRILGLAAAAVSVGLVAVRPGILDGILAGVGPIEESTRTALRARIATDPSVLRAMGREMRDLLPGYAEVRGMGLADGSLGNVPLRIVSHGRPEGVPPKLGPEVAAEYENTWQALQLEQATLSSQGRRTVAEGVGHDIPNEAPKLVATAVREVVAEALSAPSPRPEEAVA